MRSLSKHGEICLAVFVFEPAENRLEIASGNSPDIWILAFIYV